jgi:hopene-associated glycosyltransferase HpnB
MIVHDPIYTYVAVAAAALWLGLLALPWRPWGTRERLETAGTTPDADLSSVVVLIPARNEAATIGRTLAALAHQGRGLKAILIDDQSSDGTADTARMGAGENLTLEIVRGAALEPGWAGKMFALEQGRARADRPLVLLLDADIALEPGTIAALLGKKRETGAALVSLMAELSMTGPAERLLMPAFVYFFKLVYPFALSNGRTRLVAAAAGGCVLIERAVLDGIGGFDALRGAIIDDCALARAVKRSGRRTWIGLSHAAKSIRGYQTLGAIWRMVARSAYTQLNYSPVLLGLASLMLALAFWMPLVALAAFPALDAKLIGGLALLAMMASYLPTLLYYRRSLLWAAALPLIATLYLIITWSSAIDYWRGRRTIWKGRIYDRDMRASGR